MKLILTGEKVILRPVEMADYQMIYQNIQDKNIPLYVGVPYPYGQKEAKEFVERSITANAKNEERQMAVQEKATGNLIGMIGLIFKKKDGPVAEMGYWLGANYRGKGYMPEAAKLMVKYGFEQAGLEKIYGRVYLPNRASAKVFERLGFKKEGLQRKQIYRMGLVFDLVFYGLLKEEYLSQKD